MSAAPSPDDTYRALHAATGGRLFTVTVLDRAAGLARRVYTVERHRRLTQAAEAVFRTLNLNNITAITADGSRGYPEQAPFDRILVTAAAEDPPGPLLAQMKVGGIMVLPVGQSDAVQHLIKVQRTETGYEYEELRSVRFVPLVEGLGQDERS